MRDRDFGGSILRNIRPVVTIVVAILLIVVQQVYSPNTQSELVINLILFCLDMIAFVPLLKWIRSAELAATGMITTIALLYNVYAGNAPAPLSDPQGFLNSVCGLWLIWLIIKIVVLVSVVALRIHPPEILDRFSAAAKPKRNTGKKDTTWQENAAVSQLNSPSSQTTSTKVPGEEINPGQNTMGGSGIGGIRITFSSRLLVLLFVIILLLLPFLPTKIISGWFSSAKEISILVYGEAIKGSSSIIQIGGYLFILFVVSIVLCLTLKLLLYFFSSKQRNGTGKSDFFEEYNKPIILLMTAVAFVFTVNGLEADGKQNGFQLLNLFVTWLTWMIGLVLGIIGLFAVIETANLVLKQWREAGSLLKTAMHLIFVVIVQYAVSIVLGILHAFALRDVIESILMFFMPDLKDSVEPKSNQVLDESLDREIRHCAINSRVKFDQENQHKRYIGVHRGGYRRRWK